MMARQLRQMAFLLVGIAGCSKTEGGLFVEMSTDGTSMDLRSLEIGPADGGPAYFDFDAGTSLLPVSFVIDSNGNPGASASITMDVSSPNAPTAFETLHYVVDSIPTSEFVVLDVVLSDKCARLGSEDGGIGTCACPAFPQCSWDSGTCTCQGGNLPAYPLGSSESAPMSMTDAGSDAKAESGVEGGVKREGAVSDATDASTCEAGAVQCDDDADTPQECTSSGQWMNETPCEPGIQYCAQGSCIPLPTSCPGANSKTLGCESYEVTGGPFLRSDNALVMDASAPATISSFRLDAFEIDVVRFRAFVNAQVASGGPLVDAGAGVHAYLSGGRGLNGGGDAGVYETGWDPSWNAMFPAVTNTIDAGSSTPDLQTQWDTNLLSCGLAATWTPTTLLESDGLPINCVTWYEAYAFCIWDGGFLPSEAEWNYSAAGGDEQRLYPWGSTDPGTSSIYAIYGCFYPFPSACNGGSMDTIGNIADFGLTAGLGLFGQWNLAGNVAEWTLDSYDPTYPTPCTDCAALLPTGSSPNTQRVYRGGSFDRGEQFLYTSMRVPADPTGRSQAVGFRCARAP
jgi:formylglycine-generating enzyme